MTSKEQMELMNKAVTPILTLLEKRLKNKVQALQAIETNGLENLPDEVKKLRELQAMRIHAVVEEQTDVIDIIKAMYPDA